MALLQRQYRESLRHFKTYLGILYAQREPGNPDVEEKVRGLTEQLQKILDGMAHNPSMKELYLDLGNFWVKSKLYLLAIDAYQEVLRLNPGNSDAHKNLANVFFLQGRMKVAEKHFKLAIDADPNNSRAHYNYAIFLFQQNRKDEAAFHADKIRRFDPESVKMREQLKALLAR